METILNKKARKDFLKWLFNQEELRKYINSFKGCGVDTFNSISFSMQYGVYVDFFRMNNISIFITDGEDNLEYQNTPVIHEKLIRWQLEPQKSIKKARIEALRKANEIYNETRSWKQ